MQKYAPIIWISTIVALVSATTVWSHGLSIHHWMHGWMGGVLVIFSLFKLFDISAFAADFAKYDLLAMRVRTYGRAYPFIELGLGIAFLLLATRVTYAITILVFGFGLSGCSARLPPASRFNAPVSAAYSTCPCPASRFLKTAPWL